MKTILLVDDDSLTRAIIKRNIEQLGFNVIENNSGVGVLEQVLEHHPVACLIDIVMEEKEGMETILELSDIPNKPFVIAISTNPFYLSFTTELGVAAKLLKPFSRGELQVCLENLGVLDSVDFKG